MSNDDAITLDLLCQKLAQGFSTSANFLEGLWHGSIEFIEATFPDFLRLVSQMWEAWVSLFPRNDVWDPWGAACALIFVILLMTHQAQKLFAPA